MTPPVLLVKQLFLTGHDSHFAGGVHLFNCAAQSLAAACAASVHTFSAAPKAVVVHHLVTHNLLHRLQHSSSSSRSGGDTVSWSEGVDSPGDTRPRLLHHHVVTQQDGSSTSSATAALLAAVSNTAKKLAAAGATGLVLLDVDTLQHASVPRAITSAPRQGPQHHKQQQQGEVEEEVEQVPFMLALAQQLQQCRQQQQQQQPSTSNQQQQQQPAAGFTSTSNTSDNSQASWRVLVLCQNIHHLPFGPCGSAPRSPAVLQGWRHVHGVLCVSEFVAAYMQAHALPLLPQLQQQQQALHVVHPAAFGVWGPGPFDDLGSRVAQQLWPDRDGAAGGAGSVGGGVEGADCVEAGSPHGSAVAAGTPAGKLNEHQQQEQLTQIERQQQQQHVPVVGMLKLAAEKGSDLLFQLAAQLPHLQFVAVCAEPSVQQAADKAGLTNLRLIAPAADVSGVLRGMSLLLVPSVLQEAFGMVVVDAMLHGLPVVVSAAGALPEAGAGAAAAVLPVLMAEFPPHTPAAADGCGGGSCQPAMAEAAALDARLGGSSTSSCGSCNVACWLQGQRRWSDRIYPAAQPQHVERSWAQAIAGVLASRESYMQVSSRSRQAALGFVQEAPRQLEALVEWLHLRMHS